MFAAFAQKNLRLLPLLALPLLALLWSPDTPVPARDFSPEKVNLALRRAADGLLRASGDSSSRIPAIEQTNAHTWRIHLAQSFLYDTLPTLLQASLDLYGIHQSYHVAVRRCFDSAIDLGYHQADLQSGADTPCQGRVMPEGCHYIEVVFAENAQKAPFGRAKGAFMLLLLGALAAFGWWVLQRNRPKPDLETATAAEWLHFGNSRLDASGQTLVCNGVAQTLTFREAKLLRLFVDNPNRPLERDSIIQQVWADEGVLVGRSVDMFVSRLRKKLAPDPTVALTAVHGVGYRLETNVKG